MIDALLAEVGIARIPLTKGFHALIDISDLDAVSKHKWCAGASKNSRVIYAKSRVNGVVVCLHRFILNPQTGTSVDHIDGNGLNNTRANMRVCTHAENLRNQRSSLGSSSRFKGVFWNKTGWRANIRVNNKTKMLGSFRNETDAALAYDQAASEAWGAYARLNFPSVASRQH